MTTPSPSPATSALPAIRVYNTLSKRKEPLEPVTPGKIGIYLCGPTVYKEAHIGHMVGPVIFDSIKRYLQYCGYEVTWVVNITDVDDKLIGQSQQRGIPMAQVAEEMTADYVANLKGLGVDQIDHMPRATEHMGEIIRFIEELIAQGFAYPADGDVFFDVRRDAEYGKLSNRSPDDQQGEGGEAAGKKRSPGDFALWKAAKAEEPYWDSPWGRGRPGWHIECSAMSRAILGKTFDIHGGGLDLMFPHHENEIAQSECCHGKPMVKYWLHNGLLKAASAAGKLGGRTEREQEEPAAASATKMSRSQGAGGLAQLIARQGGARIRFFLLRTHYRSTIVFSEEGIEEAGTGLDTFLRYFERFERVTGESFYTLAAARRRSQGEWDAGDDPLLQEVHARRASFLAKMDDDFNTGGAISDLFDLVRALNKHVDQHGLEGGGGPRERESLRRGTATLRELTSLLGLFQQPPAPQVDDAGLVGRLMNLLIELRAEARKNKDFKTADRVRNGLTAIGIKLEDRKDGTDWRIESTSP